MCTLFTFEVHVCTTTANHSSWVHSRHWAEDEACLLPCWEPGSWHLLWHALGKHISPGYGKQLPWDTQIQLLLCTEMDGPGHTREASEGDA